MYLGQDSQRGHFFKSDLDDVKIYSRALSEAEIGQLANQYVLPLPWANVSVSTSALVGGAQCANGKYTVSGSGVLGGTADQAHHAYQTLTGDGTNAAKISYLHNTGTAAMTSGSVGTPGSQWVRIVRSGNTFTVSTCAEAAAGACLATRA